jgi:2-C-methyl-D-erythritol 4-phosphate cytidylyltransferase
MTSVSAVILAAGVGERLNLGYNKIFCEINGKPMLLWSLETICNHSLIDETVVVARGDEFQQIRKLNSLSYKLIKGGATRQESSFLGLKATCGDYVLFHDVARPYVTQHLIRESIYDAIKYNACFAGVQPIDTIKVVHDYVTSTIAREDAWLSQTPQVFKRDIILEGHTQALKDNFTGTDEATLVERLGYHVKITQGDYKNIKITTINDIKP